jgi:RNA polymerase-binding protein DksA
VAAPSIKSPSANKLAQQSKPEPPAKPDLTAAELRQVRAELEDSLAQMQSEYDALIAELNDLQQANTDGAGDDQADAGSKTFEREQEHSIAANRHDLLIQIQHAIARIDAGTYGICENCGKAIPKARLKALPMATLDADCKAREERR